MQRTAIGIDIGASNTRIAIVDEKGNVKQKKRFPTYGEKGPAFIIEKLKNEFDSLCEENPFLNIDVMGIAAAVVLTANADKVVFAPNLPGWEGVNLKKLFKQKFDLIPIIDNDTNMAVIGEFKFGVGKGFKHVVMLTLGTGVGGGIIIDGKLLRGINNFAGEIGHIPIEAQKMDGPMCSCGRRGHLEAYISGPSISRLYTKALYKQSSHLKIAESIPTVEVFKLAKKGDKLANKIIEQAGYNLGNGAATIVNLLDPEIIIVGGRVSEAGELLLSMANRTLELLIPKHHPSRTRLVKGVLGDDAGLIGAAWLALNDQ